MKRLLVRVRIWLVRVGFWIGTLRRGTDRVVLATSHSSRLTGNLAAIREGIRKLAPQTRVVTLAHRPGSGIRGRLGAALHAVRAGFHLATARLFVIDDYYFPAYVVTPRRRTRIVQTWHASGAFKKFGYSVVDKSFGATDELLARVRIHANYDLCLVGGAVAIPAYAEAFGQPPERFTSRLGIPRTDPLVDPAWVASAAGRVRDRYGIGRDTRVVLYAPTFRGDDVLAARYDDELDLAVMHQQLGADHALLMRLHPFVRAGLRIAPSLAGFAIDATDEPDLNALMAASDHLVTDYSSAIFEWSLLERPMSFLAPDLDAYERERGFYVDYSGWVPGPIFVDTESLARHLRSGPFDTEVVRAFRDRHFDVADGSATRRFVKQVVLTDQAFEP